MKYCTKCFEKTRKHHLHAHLCYCRNEKCPMFLKNQKGCTLTEKRKAVNNAVGSMLLSRMIADTLAHYELKRRMF